MNHRVICMEMPTVSSVRSSATDYWFVFELAPFGCCFFSRVVAAAVRSEVRLAVARLGRSSLTWPTYFPLDVSLLFVFLSSCVPCFSFGSLGFRTSEKRRPLNWWAGRGLEQLRRPRPLSQAMRNFHYDPCRSLGWGEILPQNSHFGIVFRWNIPIPFTGGCRVSTFEKFAAKQRSAMLFFIRSCSWFLSFSSHFYSHFLITCFVYCVSVHFPLNENGLSYLSRVK